MSKEQLIGKSSEKLLQYAESGSYFLQDQAPVYVEELLSFGVINNTIGLVVSTIITLILLGLIIFLMYENHTKQYEDYRSLGSFFCSVALLLSLVFAIGSYLELKKIEVAPRVYIVEQLKNI